MPKSQFVLTPYGNEYFDKARGFDTIEKNIKFMAYESGIMNQESGKLPIQSFTHLDAWKEGHILVLMIYKLTKAFPKEEIFGLTSQMRRCVVSITSNIAEGFSRQSYKEKVQFYAIALGSVTELQNQLLIARDVELVDKAKFQEIAEQSVKVHKIINGLIKKSKTIIHDS